MFLSNASPSHNHPLDPADVATLAREQANEVERFLTFRENHKPTPLQSLPALARELGVGTVHIKDESLPSRDSAASRHWADPTRSSGYSLEMASSKLGRAVDISEISTPAVRDIARGLTVGCATDGNHGRSVAAGAQMVGAKAVIFVHSGVTDERVAGHLAVWRRDRTRRRDI